jgi:hypothetical protein
MAGIFCVICHGWWIFPYTSAAPVESVTAELNTTAPGIKILTGNVLASNRNSSTVYYQPQIITNLTAPADPRHRNVQCFCFPVAD